MGFRQEAVETKAKQRSIFAKGEAGNFSSSLDFLLAMQLLKAIVFMEIALVLGVRFLLTSEGRKAEDPFGD
jgi:hypothetical protein